MSCNGICNFCSTPCFRGIVENVVNEVQEQSVLQDVNSTEDMSSQARSVISEQETGLSLVENIGTYEVSKGIFGRQKVRRVK